MSEPRPDLVRRLNVLGPGVGGAAALVSLDADEIVAAARAATGLHDLGEPEWEEPLRTLLDSLEREARLNVVGRLLCRHDLIRHLCNRLAIVDAHRRDPSIGARAVVAPVFITGPARSGTSILQELLALDPGLRAPLAYEMAYPTLGPPLGPTLDDETRIAWAEGEFDVWGDIHPPFRAVHDLEARLPEECLWLTAPALDHGFWSTCTDIPTFMAHRALTDQVPIYEMHRRFVQLLQGDATPTWVFKSPVHAMRLDALFAVYPDARVIRTHRDPARTVPSTISTLLHGRWTRSDEVDPVATATMTSMGLTMIFNELSPTPPAPPGRIVELQYVDLMRDPVATIAATLAALDVSMHESLPDLIARRLAARPQGHAGVHRYGPEDLGATAAGIRADFAPYIERFGVVLES
jgi:hypothetical protein